MTLVCVPIMVDDAESALRDATLAIEHGADLVEFRVDILFEQHEEEDLSERIHRVLDLVERSPATCIVTCRPHWEGGDYHGDDDERVSLYEALGTSDHPPAYIDVELATYTRSANIRQKVNLAVVHPKQQRDVTTRLILSTHDFESRPSDLTRRIITMNDEPACSVVKIAYRARSIRDNIELFEILRDRQKPTIALGMGEFGLMSRVLAPKFGGYLTFASLRDEATTAPGQPSIQDLLSVYRFRSIKRSTKVFGVIGWPVTQSMSPLIHNAGFDQIDFDAVYLPLPVEGSSESYKATTRSLMSDDDLSFSGASVTIPHKLHALEESPDSIGVWNPHEIKAANTLSIGPSDQSSISWQCSNTDAAAISSLLQAKLGTLKDRRVAIYGAGGAARAAAFVAATLGARVHIQNRNEESAQSLADDLNGLGLAGTVQSGVDPSVACDVYINCTPVGMTDGPDPDTIAVPIPDFASLSPETVFFDTVYNPIETPMLRAAKSRGYQTIDGVEMFVKQAAEQFRIWTGQSESIEALFDSLVRAKLAE